MSYATVKEVLDYSQKLHHQAANMFEQLRDRTQRERVDMVMKVLAAHEEHQSVTTAAIRDDTSSDVLSEWHQLQVQQLGDILDDCRGCHDDLNADELADLALKINDYLIALYEQLSADASSSQSRELFSELAKREQLQKVRTVRTTLSVNDW
jgi:rubrerythrin